MHGIRILVTEAHAALRSNMVEVLQRQDGISRVDGAADGLDALALLGEKEYDIVITEILLPSMSGFTLIEEMRKLCAEHAPQVIITTVLGQEDFVTRAVNMKVRFYMIKPYDVKLLLDSVQQIASEIQPPFDPTNEPSHSSSETPTETLSPTDIHILEDDLRTLLLSAGVSARIQGYQFLRTGVRLAICNPLLLHRLTKGLYPGIALESNSTVSRVERAIRHAIDTIWNRGHVDDLNKAFGCRVCSPESKPSNGEFIALLVDMLTMRHPHFAV